jgi:thiosulfate/3-mercaptopyruvate sulfurtransferase
MTMKIPLAALAGWAMLFAPSPLNAADEYPRGDLLIEPHSLADLAKGFIVLDARDKKQFAEGHVPGAQWVDQAGWAKGFGDGGDAAGWSKRIGDLGIRTSSQVVVYDDNLAKDAARIWWILRYWGVQDVRLVNGGWKGWSAAKGPVEKQAQPATAVDFKAVAFAERFADKQELLKSLKKGDLQIVDARSESEFCGEAALANKRAGAIPGAKHLEWSDLIERKTHRFKPASELKKLFAEAGIDLDRPTAAHCQSGGRSSVMAFGLELMGAKNVKNYYRSWSEWGNAEDTPVIKPTPKKKSA